MNGGGQIIPSAVSPTAYQSGNMNHTDGQSVNNNNVSRYGLAAEESFEERLARIKKANTIRGPMGIQRPPSGNLNMRKPINNGSRMLQNNPSNARLPNANNNIMSMRRSREMVSGSGNEVMGKTKLSSHTATDGAITAESGRRMAINGYN